MKYKYMLGKLIGSNTRVKILKLFISHADKKFYIRQIARDLKLQLNSVRRELENLEKFGLLVSNMQAGTDANVDNQEAAASKADKKYYRINTDFVLFEEIKALIIKAQVLYEKDFIEKIKKTGKPKLLVLTGFFVNDTKKIVDLFIVGRLNKIKLLRLIKELEGELGREINFSLMDIAEFKYRRDITDVFLYDILDNKKIIVFDEFGIS
jgi:DNA-binding transcriptional regulator YhcF (GntR family)